MIKDNSWKNNNLLNLVRESEVNRGIPTGRLLAGKINLKDVEANVLNSRNYKFILSQIEDPDFKPDEDPSIERGLVAVAPPRKGNDNWYYTSISDIRALTSETAYWSATDYTLGSWEHSNRKHFIFGYSDGSSFHMVLPYLCNVLKGDVEVNLQAIDNIIDELAGDCIARVTVNKNYRDAMTVTSSDQIREIIEEEDPTNLQVALAVEICEIPLDNFKGFKRVSSRTNLDRRERFNDAYYYIVFDVVESFVREG